MVEATASRSANLGGVEEHHAALDRSGDQGDDRVAVLGLAVVGAHAHAAQADCGDLRAVLAKAAVLHAAYSSSLTWRPQVPEEAGVVVLLHGDVRAG
jgi:hypothetical protein